MGQTDGWIAVSLNAPCGKWRNNEGANVIGADIWGDRSGVEMSGHHRAVLCDAPGKRVE